MHSILGNEGFEGGSHRTVIMDEAPAIIGKSQDTPQLLERG